VQERRSDEREGVDDSGESGGPARKGFGRLFMVAACLLFAGTAALLFLGRFEAAFLVAALGASAWFLGVRSGLIKKHDLVRVGRRDWRPRREVEQESEGEFGEEFEEESEEDPAK
jgi:hypothetical protein